MGAGAHRRGAGRRVQHRVRPRHLLPPRRAAGGRGGGPALPAARGGPGVRGGVRLRRMGCDAAPGGGGLRRPVLPGRLPAEAGRRPARRHRGPAAGRPSHRAGPARGARGLPARYLTAGPAGPGATVYARSLLLTNAVPPGRRASPPPPPCPIPDGAVSKSSRNRQQHARQKIAQARAAEARRRRRWRWLGAIGAVVIVAGAAVGITLAATSGGSAAHGGTGSVSSKLTSLSTLGTLKP